MPPEPGGWPLERAQWLEFAQMAGRIARRDPTVPVRLIGTSDGRRSALAQLPFGALVSRELTGPAPGAAVDVTARAGPLAQWMEANDPSTTGPAFPPRADAAWRGVRPPAQGWQVVDRVPGDVVRELVRTGAEVHAEAADKGLGARSVDTLLDTAVLHVARDGCTAEVTNRSLSGLVNMGFLPEGGHVIVSVTRGWTRVAAPFGNAYAAPRFTGLVLL